MKIQSKFKDYYDFIGQRFGQEPSVVYVRGKVLGWGALKEASVYSRVWRWFDTPFREDEKARTTHCLVYVIAGDYVIPVVRSRKKVDGVEGEPSTTLTTHAPLDRRMFNWLNKKGDNTRLARRYRNDEWDTNNWDRFRDRLHNLDFKTSVRKAIVKAQAPVFVISGRNGHLQIEEHTPILKDYGVASLYPASMMWMNIYQVITDVLRPNPDKAVPVQLKQEDRIVKAGFDLKSSFRHPVNKKKVK